MLGHLQRLHDTGFLFDSCWRTCFLLPLQVEDAVSRAADGTSAVQELDFSSLRSQLGPLAAVSSIGDMFLLPSFKWR